MPAQGQQFKSGSHILREKLNEMNWFDSVASIFGLKNSETFFICFLDLCIA